MHTNPNLAIVEILPEIPKSPEEKTRPIIPQKKELKIHEELQKGSEMLRKEATSNLQKYGGNFMPDFYGGKSRVNFISKPENETQVRKADVYILFRIIMKQPICSAAKIKTNGTCWLNMSQGRHQITKLSKMLLMSVITLKLNRLKTETLKCQKGNAKRNSEG